MYYGEVCQIMSTVDYFSDDLLVSRWVCLYFKEKFR